MKYRFQDCKNVKRISRNAELNGEIIMMNPYDLKTCKRDCSDYNNCNAKSLLTAEKTTLKF